MNTVQTAFQFNQPSGQFYNTIKLSNSQLKKAKEQTSAQTVKILSFVSHSNEAIQKRSNVEVNEKCVYFQALNKNNAVKKITKRYKDFS
jgi:hypothetical protein